MVGHTCDYSHLGMVGPAWDYSVQKASPWSRWLTYRTCNPPSQGHIERNSSLSPLLILFTYVGIFDETHWILLWPLFPPGDEDSLCSPGSTGTCCIDQSILKLTRIKLPWCLASARIIQLTQLTQCFCV